MRRQLALLVVSMCFAWTTSAQKASFRLSQADSLYEKKQYTQSLEHYKEILKGNEYTPAMLLKMAYIEEGLNRPGQALYYLNLYYLATSDKGVLDKMEELAAKFNIDGYTSSDADMALTYYHDYHIYVSIVLCSLAMLSMSLILFWKRKGKRSVATGTFLVIILVILLVHVNVGGQIATGIVGEPNTYLMDGPSAGASVVSVIAEGHRLEIVGKVDVWYKVKWNENTVFIKDHNLLPVRL